MTDTLQRLLDEQSALQHSMPGTHPDAFLPNDVPGAVNFLHWNVTALTDELHELLGETSWKPWAKGDFINLTEAKGEAIDALHFLLNIFLLLGMDGDEVLEKYLAKRKKNQRRQEVGYDGVSTKCPGCQRALDDHIQCEVRPGFRLGDHVGVVYCHVHGRAYPVANVDQLVALLKESK